MNDEKQMSSQEVLMWEKAHAMYEKEAAHEKKRVTADSKDRVFAVVYLLIGYGFIYTFTTNEWNLPVFTLAYIAVAYAYFFVKGRKPAAESYFWAVIMLGIGIPYPFWSVMPGFQVLVLISVAAYWTLSVSGRFLEKGKTSHWVLFDFWNAIVMVPFGNFACQVRVLLGGDRDSTMDADGGRKENRKNLLGILLGIFAAIPALMIILPLLSSADDSFARLMTNGTRYLTENFMETILQILFSIPVSAYLFGLVYGGISGRNTDRLEKEALRKTGKELRVLPDVSVYTATGIICVVYLLFIGIQGKYLFSAFAGIRPEGFTYAEYARRGFFELCAIAAFNMLILLAAGIFSKNEKEKNPGLRFLNVLLSVLTLLLIATAMSKMVMYIMVYGLTVKRILTMVFMIWMVVVFVAEIVRQWKVFPLVRICVLTGAVMFVLLCVFPVGNWIESYNIWANVTGHKVT